MRRFSILGVCCAALMLIAQCGVPERGDLPAASEVPSPVTTESPPPTPQPAPEPTQRPAPSGWLALASAPPGISALAFSPNFAGDQTIFAGTRHGGIFRSTDRGRMLAMLCQAPGTLCISPVSW